MSKPDIAAFVFLLKTVGDSTVQKSVGDFLYAVLYLYSFRRFRDIAAFVLQQATFSHPTSSLPQNFLRSPGITFGIRRTKVLR